jgi:hypothetical protein
VKPEVNLMIERGVPVIPIVPGTKRPFLEDWPALATTDPVTVEHWDEKYPDASWAAVASASTFFIVDDDSHVLSDAKGCPLTFTVRSSPGHFQHYFKQTDRSRQMGAVTQPETGGKFSIRFDRQYGIFSGKHPDGHMYEIVTSACIAEPPDDFVDYLESLRTTPKKVYEDKPAFEYEDKTQGKITEDLLQAFLKHYAITLYDHNANKFFIQCPWTDQHTKQGPVTQTAILLNNGAVGFKCMHASCEGKGWVAYRKAIEDRRAPGVEKFNFFAAKVPVIHVPTKTKQLAEYPVDVWKDTLYGEYALAASEGNHIPQSFHIECLKTITGALIGNGLSCLIDGVTPRLYTVLVTSAQGGKGTAMSWAEKFFTKYLGAHALTPLLWGSQDTTINFKTIGAALVSFGSDVGMQNAAKKQPRWLQKYEEISTLFERAGIQGSGQSLIAANRQLFDTEQFTVLETAKRAGFMGQAQNSILGATTPHLWQDMFAGAQSVGSGIFQRLSVIAHLGNIRRVSMLHTPSVPTLQQKLVSKLMALEENPQEVFFTIEAKHELSEWYFQERFVEGHEDAGRLNIIAMRNALHLAWMHDTVKIGIDEMRGGIALAEYQYDMRKEFRPNEGDNVFALVQAKIRRSLKEGQKNKRDLMRATNANRIGTQIWGNALAGLMLDEVDKGSDGIFRLRETHAI